MKKIYLVQKMERDSFKKWARKGIKVNNLDCYDEVQTLYAVSKKEAIWDCRKYNRRFSDYMYYVSTIKYL